MYNPFASVPVTGSWENHAGYSAGGTDLPLGYGTPLPAPASGTLRISGGSGEFQCGWVGSAGRRSILELDNPLPRLSPRRSNPYEAEGPCVAIVFQHQSQFGNPGWHPETDIVGLSGASANHMDRGGDVHLHWHGLDAAGNRLRLESFIGTSSTPSGGGSTPINEGEEDMTYGLVLVQVGPELPNIPKGSVFIGNGTDPVVWVSNWGPEQINGVKFAEWTAKAIAERITQVGLRGSGKDLNKVYKSMADAQAVKPVYVL